MVAWGLDDAFFAMSEYGDVAYRVGDRTTDEWSIWRETVEEWKAETAFRWSEVAYIALDPTTTDQFVAIRRDGTWAGSIADEGSAALEAFAHNFFRRASKPKGKPKPSPTSGSTSQSNSQSDSRSGSPPRTHSSAPNIDPTPPSLDPDPITKAAYDTWSTATALLFASALAATMPPPSQTPTSPTPPKRTPKKLQIRSQSSPSSLPTSSSSSTPPPPLPPPTLLTSFPYLPPPPHPCPLPSCLLQKSDPLGLRACKHDVEAVFRASGLYGYEWLRAERLRWHPDRFGRLCAEGWREEGRKVAEEMFKVVEILMEEVGRGR